MHERHTGEPMDLYSVELEKVQRADLASARRLVVVVRHKPDGNTPTHNPQVQSRGITWNHSVTLFKRAVDPVVEVCCEFSAVSVVRSHVSNVKLEFQSVTNTHTVNCLQCQQC